MKQLFLIVLLAALVAIPAVSQTKTNRDLERAKAEIERNKQEVQRELARAKAEIEQAKQESKRDIEQAKAELERAKAEMGRTYSGTWVGVTSSPTKKEIERKRKIQEAMRRGVVVMPLVTYPDDYINPGSKTDRSLPEALQPVPLRERLDCYELTPAQYTFAPKNVSTYSVYGIENTGKETRVTFAVPGIYDGQWHAFNKGKVMVDNQTGDRYFPRRIEKNIPFDKVLLINGCKGRTVLFTLVYPRLNPAAQKVTFTDAWPIRTELPLNRASRKDIVVDNVQELLQKAKEQTKGRDIY